ncbi:hypothetical protein GCM10011495_03000 [Hymenobacter frigidus]|uniref:Uncharacterized protein n=1 Tax=Hymenobacter frigidus TaxID=1524095 RepID=A0ABQ1ZWY5_9BACT|nr:hypothetical protein GCM10011495_03000 [Hymenobacter frigidus]
MPWELKPPKISRVSACISRLASYKVWLKRGLWASTPTPTSTDGTAMRNATDRKLLGGNGRTTTTAALSATGTWACTRNPVHKINKGKTRRKRITSG